MAKRKYIEVQLVEIESKARIPLYTANQISIAYGEASKYYKQLGADALAEDFEIKARMIYDELSKIGFYDD